MLYHRIMQTVINKYEKISYEGKLDIVVNDKNRIIPI